MQILILGSGCTSVVVTEELVQNSLEDSIVITYGFDIASRLLHIPHFTLILLVGFSRYTSTALVGLRAEQMMLSIHAD